MSGWVNDWKVGECMGEQKLVCARERQCERQRAESIIDLIYIEQRASLT